MAVYAHVARVACVYARWKSGIKAEKGGSRDTEAESHSRIGPGETSLRLKANRSTHEKHERKVKGTQVGMGERKREREDGVRFVRVAALAWKLPDLA